MAERWCPEEGGKFWAWHYELRMASELTWDNSPADRRIYREGNVHKSKAEAEKFGASFQESANG